MKKQRGFTTLELLIAGVILSGIAFFAISISRDLTDASLRFNRTLITNQQVQQTLQIILPEIRSAATSNNGSYPILEAASTSVTFFSDINHDGLYEQVRYFFDQDTLKKGIIAPSGSPLVYATSSETVYDLVDNVVVSGPLFNYFGEDATSTESTPLSFPIDILSVRMIEISLFANQGTTANPILVGGRNQATIRNLRYKQN